MEAKKSTPLKRKHVPDPSPGSRKSKLSPDQPGLAPIKRKRDRTGAGGKRGRPKGSFTNKTSSRRELESTEAFSSGINSHESKLNGINPGQIEEKVFGFYNQVSWEDAQGMLGYTLYRDAVLTAPGSTYRSSC